MSKQVHTHRAHCQLCASVQAIEVSTGIIAKHGYTVAHGYFSGTCPGSDRLNLSIERRFADESINNARRDAARLLGMALELKSGKVHPLKVWNGQYVKVPAPTPRYPNRTRDEELMLDWSDSTEHNRAQQVRREVFSLEGKAKMATSYADDLTKWADRIHGKVDPYLVTDLEPREWQVGDNVRIGGKGRDGFDAVIEAIEDKPYSTFGFRRGRGTVNCKHAQVTRPAREEKRTKDGWMVTQEARPVKVLWVALRDIKRPANKLAEELKKAGKL